MEQNTTCSPNKYSVKHLIFLFPPLEEHKLPWKTLVFFVPLSCVPLKAVPESRLCILRDYKYLQHCQAVGFGFP
jgi:hypothetical protein